MIRLDSVTLIDRQKKQGVFDETTTSERVVPVEVLSVKYNERYIAMANGFRPEVKFALSAYEEYRGEKLIRWGDMLYAIIGTYILPNGGIELTCERSEEDA